ncbi:MAG: hypothetical protein Ct9H90mP8_2930 [Pseudomonadota bacterium]|nr:MAG: hypothetical protein Ct9H90mP8_2930 [Pseudomonadota bacterium]
MPTNTVFPKASACPAKAEWEYTAKAGNINRDPKRIDSENLTLVAWFEENTVNLGLYGPQKVASKKPSAWGLYDMRGNVMEWVSDFYLPEYNASFHQAVSPKGPETASNPEYPLRVVRGGAWGGENGAASREGLRPSRRYAFAPFGDVPSRSDSAAQRTNNPANESL